MAKMFYTLEEAAAKLGTTPEKVREMSEKGQLQEFRDRDKLVFKREQVDLLGGKSDDDEIIPLADSGEITLSPEESKSASGSGSAMGTGGGTKERSGISIFDAEDGGDADPSDQTQVTSSVPGGTLGDPGASGSGLLDLTREADDTSLGGNLLDDVYAGGGAASGGAAGGGGDGLFETSGVASDVNSNNMGMVMAVAEPYDGLWSGITGGLAFGMVVTLGVLLFITISVMGSGNAGGITGLIGSVGGMWGLVGILAGVSVIGAVVGLVVGRKS